MPQARRWKLGKRMPRAKHPLEWEQEWRPQLPYLKPRLTSEPSWWRDQSILRRIHWHSSLNSSLFVWKDGKKTYFKVGQMVLISTHLLWKCSKPFSISTPARWGLGQFCLEDPNFPKDLKLLVMLQEPGLHSEKHSNPGDTETQPCGVFWGPPRPAL